MTQRPMKSIPVSAAKEIAQRFGYDQVVVYARRVGDAPDPFGEHMTTYGIDKVHCDVAARIGSRLQTELMGWPTKDAALTESEVEMLRSSKHGYVVNKDHLISAARLFELELVDAEFDYTGLTLYITEAGRDVMNREKKDRAA